MLRLSLPPSFLANRQPLHYFLCHLFFPEYHRVGVLEHAAFPDWLLLLSDVRLRFFCVFPWLDVPFLLHTKAGKHGFLISNLAWVPPEQRPIAWKLPTLFIQSSAEGSLGCFQVLAGVSKKVP